MKFGTTIPMGRVEPKEAFQSGEAVRQIAQAIERAGIDAASTSEHPAPDAEWLHNDPAGHDCLDPMVGLAFVAAATTRLKVFTNIVILPFRNPFLTAKAATTLQALSDDRLILGVGVGYLKSEFEALGVPYKERGALTNEALETIRLAWKGGAVSKQGRHFNATNVEPRPVPSPTPPIWVGGAADAALERAARYGDGWLPHFSTPTNNPVIKAASITTMDDFAAKVGRLRELREQFGQTGPFDIAPRPPVTPQKLDRDTADRFLDAVQALAERGATFVWTPLPHPSRQGYLEAVAWYGEEVVGRFRQ